MLERRFPRLKALASSGLRRDFLAVTILAILTLVFYWRVLTPDAADRRTFAGDFAWHYFPWRYHAAEELGKGRLPLWSENAFSGQPFLADPQTAVLYPPHLALPLAVAARGEPGLSFHDLQTLSVLHVFLTAAFTYLLVQRLTRTRLAGFTSASVFAFGGYLTSYPVTDIAIIETLTWLPLALFFATRAVESGRLAFWLFAGVALALSNLAGFPQMTLYIYYTLALYVLFLVFVVHRLPNARRWPPRGQSLVHLRGLALALTLGVVLAAVQLLPSLEFARASARADAGYDFNSGGFGIREMLGLLIPRFAGGGPLFLGPIPLLLALAAIRWRANRLPLFFALLAALALLVSVGGALPVYRILYSAAPGFSVFRDQERIAALVSLSVAILAGYGIAALWTTLGGRPAFRLAAATGLMFVVGGIAWLAFSPDPSPLASALDRGWLAEARLASLGHDLLILQIGLGGAMLILLLVAKGWLGMKGGLVLSAGVAVAQLLAVNWSNTIVSGSQEDVYPKTPLVEFLKENVLRGRVELRDLPANSGYVYGLPVVRGAGPMVERHFARLLERAPGRLWQLVNTRYVEADVASRDDPPLVESGGKGVYEAEHLTSDAYVAFNIKSYGSERDVLEGLSTEGAEFAYGQDVLVSGVAKAITRRGYISSLDVAKPEPGRVRVAVNSSQPGLLVLSEVYYPGWKAFVDGVETPVNRVNYIQRGVDLPAGPHVVEMV